MENLVSFIKKTDKISLQYPTLRSRLLCSLKNLSDKEYQQTVWIKHQQSEGNVENFDQEIHFLYDDTDLAYDPVATIGIFLYNKFEVDIVIKVIKFLDEMFKIQGLNKTDEEYINCPQWPAVIEAAKSAYIALQA